MELGAEIRFRISDVIKSVTRIQNLEDSVRALGLSVLVNFVQKKSLSEVNGERASINDKIQVEPKKAPGPYTRQSIGSFPQRASLNAAYFYLLS